MNIKKQFPDHLFGNLKTTLISFLITSAVGVCGLPAHASGAESSGANTDWPQWRGPNRDSVSPETGLALDWAAQPPREMWSAEVGIGLSTVVVVKDRAFTMGWTSNHGGEDTIWCFNAETGSVIWKYTYPHYQPLSLDRAFPEVKNLYGPNSTPCVDGDRLYTSTSSGKVLCLRADTGAVLWERNLLNETGADRNGIITAHVCPSNCASPIVIGDVVVFGVGATGVAVDKMTGKIRWGWAGGGEAYASPINFTFNGEDCVGVIDAERSIRIMGLKSGKDYSPNRWVVSYSPGGAVPDPIFTEGKLILNGECYAAPDLKKVWSVKKIGNYCSNILNKGFLYLSNQQDGQLTCVDIKDGSIKASGEIPRNSYIIMAQDKILAVSNDEINVVQASPDAIKVEGKLKLPGEKQGYFLLPSISNGRLFVRGQAGKVTVYDIRGPGHSKYAANRPAAKSAPVTSTASVAPVSKATDQDWPQSRGPLRNGVAPANNLKLDWTSAQPKPLWQVNVGPAFSGVTMVGDRIYTVGYNYASPFNYGGAGSQWTTIYCIDARNGQQIWSQNFGFPRAGDFFTPQLPASVYGGYLYWNYDLFYFGSHATPTIDGDRLYMLDQSGQVECLDVADGKVIWQKDLIKELELEIPNFYFSGSPLVLDKAVVISAGNSGVALEKETGRVLWSTGKEACGASSPIVFLQGSKPSLAILGKDKLVTLAPDTGTPIWNYNWVDGYGRNLSDPVPAGDDQLLVFGAKGKGAALLRVGSDKPVWEQKALDPLIGTPVLFQGYIYGASQSKNGVVCLNAKTGAVQWTSESIGATQVILSGDTLVIQCKNGDLRLAKASPQSYVSLGSYHALKSDNCYVSPIIAHGKLVCRSWEGDLVALDLANLDPIRVPPAAPALTQSRFKELQAQLAAPTQAQRQAAIDVLLKATDQEVIQILPAILETIKTDNWVSQDAAAQLLQQLGGRAKSAGATLVPLTQANIKSHDWAFVTILLETLKKVDPESLGQISPSIQAAIADPDQSVRNVSLQFMDRVPFTDALADTMLAQRMDGGNYFYFSSALRRLGRVDLTAGEKLAARFIPVFDDPHKPGQFGWQVASFILRDIGSGGRNAIPALVKLFVNPTMTEGDIGFANGHLPETLRCIRLVENSEDDPLQRYAYLNTPPTAKDMQVSCAAGQSVSVKMDVTDPDDFEKSLKVIVLTNPVHGKVKITGLKLEYQPEAGYVGKDTFTWKVSDPTDDSRPASMTIQVL